MAKASTTTAPASVLPKFAAARDQMDAAMIERGDEIDAALVALVAGEHLLLVGPPGTGKSMLCDMVSAVVDGERFTYLLTKFTAPEELFGPISLKGLQEDRYERITTGKFPRADVAFLDEIFKSSSAILNSLLKVLNERVYDAGTGPAAVPLKLCIAASNEWPGGEGAAELSALFDRFVIRRTVKPVSSAAGKQRLRFGPDAPPVTARITVAELEQARTEARALAWSDEAMDTFDAIIRELNREGIFPGDRREKKAVRICQAAAWLDGATQVEREHLEVLADVLWDSPDEQPKKAAVIVTKAANPSGFQINSLMMEAEQIIVAVDTRSLAKVTEAAQKLGEITRKLSAFRSHPRAAKAEKSIQDRVRALKAAALEAN